MVSVIPGVHPMPAKPAWISGAEAKRVLGYSEDSSLDDLVREGLIGKRTAPGSRLLYRRDDCEAFARVMVLPPPRTRTEATAR